MGVQFILFYFILDHNLYLFSWQDIVVITDGLEWDLTPMYPHKLLHFQCVEMSSQDDLSYFE